LLADRGPQSRIDTEGKDTSNPLGLLTPVSETPPEQPERIEIAEDPNTGGKIGRMSIEQAIIRALTNSPQIRLVSFDPAIAKAEITKATADFDPTAFSQFNYAQDDNPQNSLFQPGESDVRMAEGGVRQKTPTGAEWSLSYGVTRSWDDLVGRTLSTRYEPMFVFEVRQPLLRDAWKEVNLAGVNIAKLNHTIQVMRFRQRAEDISTQVISAYWLLVQARSDLETHEDLLNRTMETLNKVQGRRGIDATAVQVKQAEASARSREAFLVRAQKRVFDVQDALLALMADSEANILMDTEIVPTTEPYLEENLLDTEELIALAMQNNPQIQESRLGVEMAEVNINVAQNQYMPRVDLVASGRSQGIGEDYHTASDTRGDYASYGVGIVLEYPLGNRQRFAERQKRRLERRKAISSLHALSDQVTLQVKEKIRKVEANYTEIEVQKQATAAARIHLQALQDTEEIREQLTPEFLLVKLQAQQDLAQARRAEASAITNFNIAIAEVAQASGTVLELHRIQSALDKITAPEPADENDPQAPTPPKRPFFIGPSGLPTATLDRQN
jgi:outer membrane protein TolC